MNIEISIPTGIGGFLLALFFGWLCLNMAKSRNRSPLFWGVLGFFFGCFPVILLALLGKKR